MRNVVRHVAWLIPGEVTLLSNARRAEAEAWASSGKPD